MDFDIDGTSILYGVGALLGAAAVLYFSREIIFNLSPTVKTLLLFGGFAAFLFGAFYNRGTLERTFYALSSISYLVFLVYMMGKFQFTTEETFLTLGLSSVLFIGIGYAVREREMVPDRETARNVLIGIVVVAAVLVAVDVVGPQPTYDVEFVDEVDATTARQVTLGTVTIQNGFIFSRDVDLPEYRACIYIPERRPTYVSTRDAPSIVSGQSTETVELTASIPMRRVNDTMEEPDLGVIPVEQMEECPETAETGRIVVTESGGDGREVLVAER